MTAPTFTPDDDTWDGFYVARDEAGAIVGLTRGDMGCLSEQLAVDDAEVEAFSRRGITGTLPPTE